MSLLTRPSVVFTIVFACFAVLIPRIFLPLFRMKPPITTDNFDDHFRRPPPPMSHNDDDNIQHISGSPPHMRGAHPNMRMHHPGAHRQQQTSTEHGSSKSIVTLALPMYTVGIGIFFIYTCFKYWSKKDIEESKPKQRPFRDGLLWNNEKRKLQYDILDKDSEGEEENKEDFYAGLDPDYIEYLKTKKQKALDAERHMTDEQKQMHFALEEMKKSLSYISSRLVNKENRGNLNGTEIIQLQERLVSTEAQMCKILTALDAASDRVTTMTTSTPVKPSSELCSSSDDDDVPNQVDDDEKNEDRSESLSNRSYSENSLVDEEDNDQCAPIITNKKKND